MKDWIAALVLVAVTVLVHGFGTFAIVALLLKRWQDKLRHLPLVRIQFILAWLVVMLFVLHGLEAAVWAGFYLLSGALPDFPTAMYFSLTSYTTVGYGDILLDGQWRLLGALEACIGVLMLGWSTGIIFAIVSRQFEGHLRGPKNDV